MSKGYWIAHVDVNDMETYKNYIAGAQAAFAKFGARYLVRGGTASHAEGDNKPRTVVIEFPSTEAAKACYESPEYQAAKRYRQAAATADLLVIEGYDGAQPGG
jgi:uncharacterized protein (DUF1330 family)